MKVRLFVFIVFLSLAGVQLLAQGPNTIRMGGGVNITSKINNKFHPSFGPCIRIEYERSIVGPLCLAVNVQNNSNHYGADEHYMDYGLGLQVLARPQRGFFNRLIIGVGTGINYSEKHHLDGWNSYLNFDFGPVLKFNFINSDKFEWGAFVHPKFYYFTDEKAVRCGYVNVGTTFGINF